MITFSAQVRPGERTIVLPDSRHPKQPILAELNAYARWKSNGLYIVAMDGIMKNFDRGAAH